MTEVGRRGLSPDGSPNPGAAIERRFLNRKARRAWRPCVRPLAGGDIILKLPVTFPVSPLSRHRAILMLPPTSLCRGACPGTRHTERNVTQTGARDNYNVRLPVETQIIRGEHCSVSQPWRK